MTTAPTPIGATWEERVKAVLAVLEGDTYNHTKHINASAQLRVLFTLLDAIAKRPDERKHLLKPVADLLSAIAMNLETRAGQP